jgi:imidazole glycerol-phosphate synthase subunit HisH
MTSTRTTIAIVDYGMGNRRSVEKAFLEVGAEAWITAEHDEILNADGAVIVGVGAFPEAMRRLKERGLVDVLRTRYELKRPILGICLGLQMFFERSEEHEGANGLGFLAGTVRQLPSNGHKVPHVGWNQVQWRPDSRLCVGVDEDDSVFYHLHSFAAFDAVDGDDFFSRPDVAGKTTYSCAFVTAIERPPLYGVQFHPEKSSHQGLQLLRNFVEICGEREPALL